MNIEAVQAEIATKLDAVPGLNVVAYDAESVTPPAVLFAVPENYQYDNTYGRGSDSFVLPITVLVGRASARAARRKINEFISGSGDLSIKRVVDDSASNTYTACHSVTIRDVELGTIRVAAVDYLGATFNAHIVGPGD